MRITPLSITQWDINPRIELIAFDAGVEVHYAQCGYSGSPVVDPYYDNGKLYADIPNCFAQNTADICVWVFCMKEGRGKTAYTATISVFPKPKPDDYVHTETEIKRWDDLYRSIKDIQNDIDQAIIPAIGDIRKLETAQKESLVDAVNEVLHKCGGGSVIDDGEGNIVIGEGTTDDGVGNITL